MTQYVSTYDLVKGKKLADRYTIVGPSRQSGFAATYEARDPSGEPCEVSLFPTGLFEQADQAEEFHARLTPWREVGSENVLHVREVISIAGGMLLVTDMPKGEALRERLNREKVLGEVELVTLATQLLSGLARVHGAGLVHGDIKPPTILLHGKGESLEAMLVDGGVTPSLWNAKGLGEKTALIGTPYYAPVEQFGGDSPDVRSDIYNLATVLYECATGVLPWRGSSFLEVFQSKLTDPPDMTHLAPDLKLSQHVQAAILHGCQADRRKRHASASEFLQAMVGTS